MDLDFSNSENLGKDAAPASDNVAVPEDGGPNGHTRTYTKSVSSNHLRTVRPGPPLKQPLQPTSNALPRRGGGKRAHSQRGSHGRNRLMSGLQNVVTYGDGKENWEMSSFSTQAGYLPAPGDHNSSSEISPPPGLGFDNPPPQGHKCSWVPGGLIPDLATQMQQLPPIDNPYGPPLPFDGSSQEQQHFATDGRGKGNQYPLYSFTTNKMPEQVPQGECDSLGGSEWFRLLPEQCDMYEHSEAIATPHAFNGQIMGKEESAKTGTKVNARSSDVPEYDEGASLPFAYLLTAADMGYAVLRDVSAIKQEYQIPDLDENTSWPLDRSLLEERKAMVLTEKSKVTETRQQELLEKYLSDDMKQALRHKPIRTRRSDIIIDGQTAPQPSQPNAGTDAGSYAPDMHQNVLVSEEPQSQDNFNGALLQSHPSFSNEARAPPQPGTGVGRIERNPSVQVQSSEKRLEPRHRTGGGHNSLGLSPSAVWKGGDSATTLQPLPPPTSNDVDTTWPALPKVSLNASQGAARSSAQHRRRK